MRRKNYWEVEKPYDQRTVDELIQGIDITITEHTRSVSFAPYHVYPIHRFLAEMALGKPLPEGAQVHHMDRNPHNNDPENLVICPDQKYHALLHKQGRELGYYPPLKKS